MIHTHHSSRLLLLSLLALLFTACVKVGNMRGNDPSPATPASAPLSSQPQVSLCLNSTSGSTAQQVKVVFDAIELSDGGQWVSLLHQPVPVTAEQATAGTLLERVQIAAGQYTRIRYRISQALAGQNGREIVLQVPSQPVEYVLTKALSLKSGDSVSLFLHWDIAASLRQSPKFMATIGASEQRIPLTTELAFVSCPEINTVYIIRTDQNRICGSWGISGRPTYLKAFKKRNELYVLAADQSIIKVFELSSGRLKDQIRLPMVLKPSFMAIDQLGSNAYLLDRATDTVYRIDLASGTVAAQQRVGDSLTFAVFLEDQKRLAVAAGRSQKVLLLEPASLKLQQSIRVGGDPQGVLGYNSRLYVAEGLGNSVSLHDISSGKMLRQNVGLGPSRLLSHNRTLFVSNKKGGSLTLLNPEQMTIMKEIDLGGAPGEMAASTFRNWLYVNDAEEKGVAVIDLSSNRLLRKIDLQAEPLDIDVIQ